MNHEQPAIGVFREQMLLQLRQIFGSAGSRSLRDDVPHHSSRDIGEPEIAAGMTVGQLLVVEAEQVQHGRVEIVNARSVFDGAKTELVRRPIRGAAAHAPAGEPDAEAVVIVIAAEL